MHFDKINTILYLKNTEEYLKKKKKLKEKKVEKNLINYVVYVRMTSRITARHNGHCPQPAPRHCSRAHS